MSQSSVTVVKLGGSLLDWPELPRRLGMLLDAGTGGRSILVVGGGAMADVIRSMDRVHGLDPRAAHDLAVGTMEVSAALLAALMPSCWVAAGRDAFEAIWRAGGTPILAPRWFLGEVDALRPDPLPASWDVTSDSIAARVAEYLGASRLILLKSVAPKVSTLGDAARTGLVDPYFPTAAARLPRIEVVCLRDSPPAFHPLVIGEAPSVT